MNVETPRLEIHIDRIAHNASAVISQCGAQGIRVAAVTKVMQAHPALLRALEGSGCVMLADSRIDNLKRIAEAGLDLPTMPLGRSHPHLLVSDRGGALERRWDGRGAPQGRDDGRRR